MARTTLGDRVAAAAVGVFFGAIVGFIVAWLLGVHSRTFGTSGVLLDFKGFVFLSAAGFGLVGLLFGPVVGSLLGSVFGGLYELERAEHSNPEVPTWLAVVVLFGVAIGVWWWRA